MHCSLFYNFLNENQLYLLLFTRLQFLHCYFSNTYVVTFRLIIRVLRNVRNTILLNISFVPPYHNRENFVLFSSSRFRWFLSLVQAYFFLYVTNLNTNLITSNNYKGSALFVCVLPLAKEICIVKSSPMSGPCCRLWLNYWFAHTGSTVRVFTTYVLVSRAGSYVFDQSFGPDCTWQCRNSLVSKTERDSSSLVLLVLLLFSCFLFKRGHDGKKRAEWNTERDSELDFHPSPVLFILFPHSTTLGILLPFCSTYVSFSLSKRLFSNFCIIYLLPFIAHSFVFLFYRDYARSLFLPTGLFSFINAIDRLSFLCISVTFYSVWCLVPF